jgi:hypothetical protein
MPTVDDLLDAYRAAYRAGDAVDPTPFLDQLEGADRRELAAYIEAFLAAEPARAYDVASFAAFAEEPLTARIRAATTETWATLLPAAREAAQLKRSTLTQRLADALGVGDRADKVARYYHRMETGTLPGDGVSDRVLDALSALVGVSPGRLRAAGRRQAPPAFGAEGAVFARSASKLAAPAPAQAAAAAPAPAPRDAVDDLFAGTRYE